jgi:nitrile hydratase subunit alpha
MTGHGKTTQIYKEPIRVKALESLLIEKGVITEEDVNKLVTTMSREWRSWPGARVVARAWMDAEFKRRLLANTEETLAEQNVMAPGDVKIVENTETVHNVVVCTLCSCYPMQLLGFPPPWFVSTEYRARMVIEPRAVLREFGLNVPDGIEIRVWDSLGKRIMVMPLAPAGSQQRSLEELAASVTAELLVGTAR